MHQTATFVLALVMLISFFALGLTGCDSSQHSPKASGPASTGLARLLGAFTSANKSTVTHLDTLAQQFLTEGKYELAEQQARQALRILEDAWGDEHINVAPALDRLADIYGAQGKAAEAEPFLHRALTIREKVLGAQHPEMAASLERYAAVLRQLHREPEAQPLAARAQAIRAQGEQTKRPPG
ncbi:MAG: tetratricopeptide repeat protein [Candidatus Tectimicrobiota bacterium]